MIAETIAVAALSGAVYAAAGLITKETFSQIKAFVLNKNKIDGPEKQCNLEQENVVKRDTGDKELSANSEKTFVSMIQMQKEVSQKSRGG
jgi:hypothetical protein